MLDKLNSAPLTTILVAVAFVIVCVVGGVVTIVNPDTLSFSDYVERLGIAAGALGLLAIGRGINLSGEKQGNSQALAIAAEEGYRYDEDPDLPPPDAVPEDEGGTTLG